MSNEIISILSSDGDDSTIVSIDDTTVIQLLSPLPVKSEPADDHRVTSSTVRSVTIQNLLFTSRSSGWKESSRSGRFLNLLQVAQPQTIRWRASMQP